MGVDPWLNSAYQDPTGVFWAGEVCDPVEHDEYAYAIDGVLVSDFVTPRWFGHARAPGQRDRSSRHPGRREGARLDLGEHADTPFQILSGGFAQRFEVRRGWVQVTGERASARGRTVVRGSRRERRARQASEMLQRSGRRWSAV
jgi:hypothetical protein